MRPHRLYVISGTATEVGKTWVSEKLLSKLRDMGLRVAARKPAQSFAKDEAWTDADRLGAASGEKAADVCPKHRWYPVAMAPPMAAAFLGLPAPTLAELSDEISVSWPVKAVDFGVVEGAGGVASPLAVDGDTSDLARSLNADAVVLVADSGLGTINSVRLSAKVIAPLRTVVFLNRFHTDDDLHRRNREWLQEHEGITVATDGDQLAVLLSDEDF